MDCEPVELSRERAVSSEPCSTRPNPFDDNDQSSRKRQRISRAASRSHSVDAARASDISMSPPQESTEMPTDPPSPPPSTPPPKTPENLPAEPTSSRVTINLRTAQPLEIIPSSPPSPSTPSKMVHDGEETGPGVSVESESDVLSTVPADTPSSSPSAPGSPQIELVVTEDDDDFGNGSPPVAIIGADEIYQDPMQNFPYAQDGESLVATAKRLSTFIQYDALEDDKCFTALRDWIEQHLQFTSSHPDGWYENYSKYRGFWLVLPEVIWALSWRSRYFGRCYENSRQARITLSEFLVQFARLTGRFVAMDARTLSLQHKADSDQEPDLAYRGYLQAFGFLLRKHESPHIGRNLEAHYNWNWSEDMVRCMNGFRAEGGILSNLSKLVRGELSMLSSNPKIIIECLIDPCRIARKLVDDAAAVLDDPNLHRQHAEDANKSMVQGFDFFKAMSAGLESIIEKHFTFLTPDAAYNHIESLWTIYHHTLSWENDATRDVLENRHRERPELSFRLLPRVISCEWKFAILKKLICSTQMQLRVVGVTRMCQDLLEIYNGSKIPDPPSNPLLLYFAEFIMNHKLVDYLVGTGSHPEIITESNNIVGFLIVTKTYTDQQSDKIWHTVISSQDPRVVEAILKMLSKCLPLMDYHTLLYLCEKAKSFPIEGFTMTAREYCQSLFVELVRKAHNEGASPVDSPPYDLCVRLIRQSSIITSECPAGYPDVQNFAAGRFRELLVHGPNLKARSAIYRSCVEDITARTDTAPGSICVIYALLRQNTGTDLHTLTTEHGLTKLVVEELRSTILGDRLLSNPSIRNSPASQARRELLLTIIINEPETILPDLGAQLWDLLVGKESKSVADRSTWWNILNRAVKESASSNVFIDSCFKDYLPKLPPDCFTLGALDFARAAISSWLEEVRVDFAEEDRAFDGPALQQLWRMIVTAPPNTIDGPAINSLVDVYLDSALIMSMPRAKARSIHLTLVDRCLKELAAAATKLKAFSGSNVKLDSEAMVLVASEHEFSEQEIIFARSLAVLREFLKAYQLKPRFAIPKSKSPIGMAQNPVKGEPFTVMYQSFDGDKHTEVKSLTVGKLNNTNSLIASLQKATGFTNYKVYYGGKLFDPDESNLSKSLDDLNLNGLFLVQRREDADSHSHGKTSLELEITKHFEELWGYLAMHEKVAQEIYYFLVKFPVNDRVLDDIASETTSYSQIFPVGQPFKSLYAIHALREYTTTQSQMGNIEDESLTRAIVLVIAAISDQSVIDQSPTDELRDILALHFMDCFLQLLNLKETAVPAAVSPYLNDGLLQRLLALLDGAKSESTTPNSVYLASRSFEAILDACIHNSELWNNFKLHLSNSSLLHDLLLDDPRPLIRKNVMKQLLNKCAFSPRLAQVSTTEFAVAFWPMVAVLIPHAVKQPQRCEETLMVSHHLFKKLADTSIDSFNLDELISQWSALLLSHAPNESVGYSEVPDLVTFGLAQLLFCVASFAKASQQILSASTIGLDLLRELLFPELNLGDAVMPRLPVLNTLTRHLISETVWFLVKDDAQQYKDNLLYLSHLVPYESNKFDDVPYAYEPLPFLFERSKAIRSPTGYVGLKNLSNTCYLNSLFTQLFMNVPFREFMLTANVADRGSQRLLAETQNLFSYMQNSLTRFVDPGDLAGSIQTYDETPIDVSIQMDVDEFYNLLFDRWEGQILSPEAKKQFRSFYGGQLVQQVKSKECPHISERLEPFSAIQCDIKGKSCLQESLQAYVDGEIMEGDNKYNCSTCDRHVDAVKRACLKDVPDNLIFHLKRFDFNLRTLTRSKINDHFSFPTKIDMRPYKVEHLSDKSEDSAEDMFELVGVLVHSGTAESGHYYSYIRERPSNGDKEHWVEFNDDLVTTWDPSCLEGACFGGYDVRSTLESGNLQYDKTYSAYMLFYQRSSVLATQKQDLEVTGLQSPVRLEIAPDFAQQIEGENEILMRKYCLYDPSHAAFVTKMLGNIKVINQSNCSQDHALEKLALTTALNHMDQVFARTKDLPDFPTFMLTLRQLCHSCAECSRDFLEWFCDCPEALRHQLLRNPDSQVRSEIASSILSALSKVKGEAAYAYGFGEDESSEDDADDEANPPRVIQRLVTGLHKLWDMFEKNCRAWPEYFGLLASIASMGVHEAALLLDMGFLRKSLEIICADPSLPMAAQYTRMFNIISKRLVNRPVSYDAVILLLCRLFHVCEPFMDPTLEDQERLEVSLNGGPIPLTFTERNYLIQHWTKGDRHILVEKLLRINQNVPATRLIIVRLLQWPEGLDSYIYSAICHGIRKGTSDIPSGPFLRAAVLYCEHSDGPRAVRDMLNHVSQTTTGLDNTEGREFLQFFKDVYDLRPNVANIPIDEVRKHCLQKISKWAPDLLTYYEQIVRQETEDFLRDIILRHPTVIDAEAEGEEAAKAELVIWAARQLGISCLEYLEDTYILRRAQAVRSNLLNIHSVIDSCAGFFDADNKEEATRRFLSLRTSVIPKLRQYTVEEADEDVSDWDESGEEYGSSEPMELGDVDVQL